MECNKAILDFTGTSNRTPYAYPDIYYIPKSKMKDFATVASIFYKHGSYVAVAVSSTLICLDKENLISIQGVAQANKKGRKKPWINIDTIYRDKNPSILPCCKVDWCLKSRRTI